MTLRSSIALAFAATTLLSACTSDPAKIAARVAADEAENVAPLQRSDSAIFKRIGFNIVARTGYGGCDRDGRIGSALIYNNNSTDIAYLLSRPGSPALYTACMNHSYGQTNMQGLKMVDRIAPAPK